MKLSKLPLQDLFNRLRDHGFSLGVDEYMALLRALRAGYGVSTRQEFRQLCMALWVKSEDDVLLFDRLFDQMIDQLKIATNKESLEDEMPDKDQGVSKSDLENKEGKPDLNPMDLSQPDVRPSKDVSLETDEPTRIVQAIQLGKQSKLGLRWARHLGSTNYFPVTRRQMKQSWRHLRRPVREGPPVELDIDATVEKISRDGIFLEPVLLPRRSNRAEIILLVDQDGSMSPFHGLSRQLVDTIRRGGRLQQTNVYYFHDCPSSFLYLDPARLAARELSDVFASVGVHTTVLLVSDAGAARGNFDDERTRQTNVFIQKLKQYVRRFAWINPLPSSRWPGTTAGEIARFVPMFDMSRRGLEDAVNTLRGRYVYGEKLYPWMF